MAVIITLVLIFVGIVFLVLLHVCFSEWFSRRGGRESMVERGSSSNTNGGRNISMIDLEKLPCYDYVAKDNNTSSSPVDCAVCLENLTTGDKCRLLPICKHSFHAHCVDKWLLKTPICPICRSRAGSLRGKTVIGNNDNGYFIEPNSMLSGQSQSRDVGIELREVESEEHSTGTIENQIISAATATTLAHAAEFAAL